MTVVSNTSPLCYLAWIEHLRILPSIFGAVNIPLSVLEELTASGTPEVVAQQFRVLPEWLLVDRRPLPMDATLSRLHSGERDAILLAESLQADLLFVDDRDARQIARDRGLNITGLLGILSTAGCRGILDLVACIESLQQTSFRASPQLLKWALDQVED